MNANMFNSSSADPLVAVSFYATAPSSDYEILIYNRDLSTAEMNALNTYLKNKWGI